MKMNRWLVSTVVTTIALASVTVTPALADDGGDGGNYFQSGHGQHSGNGLSSGTISQWLSNFMNGGSSSNSGSSFGNPPQLPAQTSVTLSAGWNLVDQNVVDALQTSGSQVYSYFWNGHSYQSTSQSQGDGIWVYLSAPSTVLVNSPSSASETVSIGAMTWGMVGNPYQTAMSVTLQKGDVAYTYNPTTGQYSQALMGTVSLQPGQGAWLFSASGGTYTIGIQPPAPPSQTVTSSVYSSVYGN